MQYGPTILAQAHPGAAVEIDLYKVPAGSKALLQQIIGCNTSANTDSFRVSISKAGAATTDKDYIFHDWSTAGHVTNYFNFGNVQGLLLDAGDVVRVYAANNDISFTLIGALV